MRNWKKTKNLIIIVPDKMPGWVYGYNHKKESNEKGK